jgi:hypothetical protein
LLLKIFSANNSFPPESHVFPKYRRNVPVTGSNQS